MSLAYGFGLIQELSKVVFYPPLCGIILMDLSINFLDLDYADDLSTLDESESKMNELTKVSRVQGARITFKMNVKRT